MNPSITITIELQPEDEKALDRDIAAINTSRQRAGMPPVESREEALTILVHYALYRLRAEQRLEDDHQARIEIVNQYRRQAASEPGEAPDWLKELGA